MFIAVNPLFAESSVFIGATTSRPANVWTEAMLTGNGNMGIMMFGNPYNETIVLNHCKLYLPVGSREIVHDLAGSMPEFKKAGLEAGANGPAVVHKMMLEKTKQRIIGTDSFHPAFFLKLSMTQQSENPTKYKMTEDFTTGELKVNWFDEHGGWERKIFVSRPDNVAVMEINGPKGKVGCSLSMDIKHKLVKSEIKAADGYMSAHVVYVRGKGGYDSLIRVVTDGGKIEYKDGQAIISGANRVLLLMQVKNWRTPLPKEQSEAWAFSPENPYFGPGHKTNHLPDMNKELAKLSTSYKKLFKSHRKIHGELFSRVKLDLNGGADRNATTEELLDRAAKEDHASLALLERMYDACRYLIICSSGERPSNLQGIWTGTWSTAWSGDYTLDSNIQLEIQSLMSCNMPELMESYFDLVESWLPDCRLNAKKFYGCRGVVSNARASNVCLLLHWGRWPGEQLISCMGWMAHFFYDYYQFTGDKEFLAKRAIPLMKEVVLFYEDLLAGTEDENGKYRFFMSYSPENVLAANATFDIGVTKAMLTYLIKSCEMLSIEKENVKKWKTMLAKMPPYQINEKGEYQEWAWPGVKENLDHRHHSQFLPLYQFCEIDRDRTPDLWKAAGVVFENKLQAYTKKRDDNPITHGLINQAQCAARLGRSDVVYDVLSRFTIKRYVNQNFMMAYMPGWGAGFGFDPVGSIPDIVNNSLLFMWDKTLDVLPALPEQWPEGSIKGILLRDQVKLNGLFWKKSGKHIEMSLTSKIKQDITLRLADGNEIESVKIIKGSGRIKKISNRKNCYRLSLNANEEVLLKIKR